MIIKKKEFIFNQNIMTIIVNNIRKYRRYRNLTQEELAFYTDLSNDFIRRIESENGKRGVSLYTLYKISIVLETSIEKFFEE
ncbi:helix-turn-helix transcriptional regulator [[Clostridium] symbiosum]|uniref:helix-turn-helix domain-containing protein n=1 Tax=Clostridium symbiosum TaxID=1512 RepID=UPI001D073065|nr:helix-turn-helix transcriptional regulator [[Clostridium] symbiosum]MCB6608454.1 helix-turn-helix transcriptional regulator [[Clostridium] symbiosum]MCB6930668.1 helix-turn-helix transcriptional regulator [[Clostridium] symbiosum]